MLHVLLTNDDGIGGAGLRQMALNLARHARVTVVAPDRPNSAISHAITLHKPLRMDRVDGFRCEGDPPRIEAYECSGTPSDCVTMGVLYLLTDAPPDLVISGINDGINVAQDLSYSGTVGGALEGAVIGVPSLAVSLEGQQRLSFDQAAELTSLLIALLVYGHPFPWQMEILRQLASHPANPDTPPSVWALPAKAIEAEEYPTPGAWQPPGYPGTLCLNVNIPDLALPEIKGICWTRAGYREYRDVVHRDMDPRGKTFYWIAGEKVLDEQVPGSDTYGLGKGYITVTPVTYDITHLEGLNRLAAWSLERSS